MADTSSRYSRGAVVIHWLIALLMIPMVFFGENLMGEGGEGEGAAMTDTMLPSLHVTVGITILLLTALRVIWRVSHPSPPLPASMAPWEVTLTKIVHGLFYILMVGLPVSGWLSFPNYLSENAAMAGVKLFGLFAVPMAPNLGLPAGLFHSLGSNVAMALIILHVLAALKHQFVNRDGLLSRMRLH